ncbi:hypothetical protein [Aquimarina longa]|uniref:hypothetical protein n=1 Tax=Aquimarina longa TaxID=1080221 RepID=UPI000784B2DE|nr:hypothetical protein [Aquimarina longa]
MKTEEKISIISPDTVDKANFTIAVDPDGYIIAKIANKEQYTPEELAGVRWIARMIHGAPEFTRKDFSNAKGAAIKVKAQAVFSGIGYGWIEPVFENEQPKNTTPYGYFVRYNTPIKRIVKVEWRAYSKEKTGPLLQGDKCFGEAVQLHIYTKGMYGHKLKVELKDYDMLPWMHTDDLDLDDRTDTSDIKGKYFTRQVRSYPHIDDPNKIVQKVVINVQIEHRWKATAGDLLKIAPTISTDVKGMPTKAFKAYLSVRKKRPNEQVHSPLSKQGNKFVVIGDIATDVAHFKPCRYEKITKEFEGIPPVTLFSKEEDVNVNASDLDVGVIAHDDSCKKMTLKIENLDLEDCTFLGKPHDHNKKFLDITKLQKAFPDTTLVKSGTTSELSFTPKYPYKHLGDKEYLDFFTTYFPVFSPEPANFVIPIESCAFKKKIHLSIHPDVAFAYHLFIGNPKKRFDKKIYFRNTEVQLIRGLKDELDWVRKMQGKTAKFLKYLPGNFLQQPIQAIVMDYLENQAKSFAFGMHGYHSYQDTLPTVMNYTAKYSYIAKIVIGYLLGVTVVIDALLLYLTRGKNITGILKVARNVKKASDFATGKIEGGDRDNIEFIWPQISSSRGIGYTIQPDGRTAVVLQEKVVAAPLFALQYKLEETIGSFVAKVAGITGIFDKAEQVVGVVGKIRKVKNNTTKAAKWADKKVNKEESDRIFKTKDDTKTHPISYARPKDVQEGLNYTEKLIHKKIDDFAKKYGQEAKLTLTFSGFYDAHYDLSANILTKTYTLDIFEDSGKKITFFGDQKAVFGKNRGVDVFVKLEAKSITKMRWSKLNEYTPEFLGVEFQDTCTEVELEGELAGSINFERLFTFSNTNEPQYTDTVIFTGIKGSVYLKLETRRRGNKVFEKQIGRKKTIKDGKGKDKKVNEKVVYTIVPAFTIKGAPTPIFEKPMVDQVRAKTN